MDTNHFIQLRKIFDQAVLLPASAWETFLQTSCGADSQLLAEAKALLQAHLNDGSTHSTEGAETAATVRMIGPYRILRQLGAGGMGVVYLAVRDDGAFRKHVAVKLLKGTHASSDLIQRFHQERQVLANLDHPNIARILDGGQTAEGLPYYVMDYVEGLTLDRFCDTQKLNLADRIRLFQQVVSSTQYLHDNLVIHRDLKPANILVTADGLVKLLDFGIAKTQTPLLESPDLTGPANRILTPNYASPEQMAGAPMSKASDIYSLGVILYELLTGQLPYANAASKLSGDPPLPSANIREDLRRTPETTAQLRRRIVGDLDQIVLLCLRHDPRHRYASAAALGNDLDRFLEGRSVVARKEPVIERTLRFLKRKRIAVTVVLLLLLSAGIGAWKTVQVEMRTQQLETQEDEFKRLIDSLNHQLNSTDKPVSPTVQLDNVRKLRHAMEQKLAPTWSVHPGDISARRALLDQVAGYLDSLRPSAAHDLLLAMDLARTYRELGMLFELCSKQHALDAYQTAATLIRDSGQGDVTQSPNGEDWAYIVGRIKILGGTVPNPKPSASNSPPENHPDTPSHGPPQQNSTDDPQQPEPPDPPPQVSQEEYDAVLVRYDSAVSKAKSADQMMGQIRKDVEQMGESVNPDILATYERMNRALNSARQALDKVDLAAARENIVIATECARRVLHAGGR